MADWFSTNIIIKPRKGCMDSFQDFRKLVDENLNADEENQTAMGYIGHRSWFEETDETFPDNETIHLRIVNGYSPEGAAMFCYQNAKKYKLDVYAVYSHEYERQDNAFWNNPSIGKYIIKQKCCQFTAPDENDVERMNEYFNMAWEGYRSPDGFGENYFNQNDSNLYSITSPSLEDWFLKAELNEEDYGDEEEIESRKEMGAVWFRGANCKSDKVFIINCLFGEDENGKRIAAYGICSCDENGNILDYDSGPNYIVDNHVDMNENSTYYIPYSLEWMERANFYIKPLSVSENYEEEFEEDYGCCYDDPYFFGYIYVNDVDGNNYLVDKDGNPVKSLADGVSLMNDGEVVLVDSEDWDFDEDCVKEEALDKYPKIKAAMEED